MKWFPEKLETFADRTAIIDKGCAYSYYDLHKRIKSYIDQLKSFTDVRLTVVLAGKYSFETIAAFFALFELNQIISLFADNEKNELDLKLKILEPDVVIELLDTDLVISKRVSTQKYRLIETLKSSGNSGLVLFTSGTTGEPKAILHNLDSLTEQYKRDYTKDLNIIPLLGFDHIGGLDMMLSQLAIGGTITIPEKRTPKYICETIEKHKVNVISASPTFLNLLLISEAYQEYDLSSLKIIGYGSEPMSEWLLEKLNMVFPRVSFQQKYGLSETNAVRIRSKSKNSLFFRIDDPTVDFRIVENELWLKSPSVFAGYLAVKENSDDDGWFRTGDIVESDIDGFIKILGRKSDIINVGGEKVFPAEIESVLFKVPFIRDCQVLAEKSLITGNMIVAKIVSDTDKTKPEQKQEIRKFLLSRLNRYKIPVKFCFVDSIDYNARMKKIRNIQ